MPILCASVKRKGVIDQCPARALAGHTLCGRHARSKHVVLWAEANQSRTRGIVKAQAVVRGWLVRTRLSLGGPGVLRRRNLANDDDLETCEESSKEHPFSYFAFEEAGKIWWFHFPTLWRWSLRNLKPTNPYTKVPLSSDTRKRLRAVWSYNRRHKLPLPQESANTLDRIEGRWNIISQLFDDNGFGDLDPGWFSRLTKRQIVEIFHMIKDDINVTITHQRVQASTRRYVTHALSLAQTNPAPQFLLQAAYLLMLTLITPKDPYPLAFTVLSAMYRC
jgi:hypothetical protein